MWRTIDNPNVTGSNPRLPMKARTDGTPFSCRTRPAVLRRSQARERSVYARLPPAVQRACSGAKKARGRNRRAAQEPGTPLRGKHLSSSERSSAARTAARTADESPRCGERGVGRRLPVAGRPSPSTTAASPSLVLASSARSEGVTLRRLFREPGSCAKDPSAHFGQGRTDLRTAAVSGIEEAGVASVFYAKWALE